MRYQHSFWYRESRELFEEVLKADSDCGIAYWGMVPSGMRLEFGGGISGNMRLSFQAARSIG